MKITTWNVNGLRAVFRKGADAFWQNEQPEVLCLQEIRARPDQLSRGQRESLASYTAVWNPAQQAGYSGVATLIREGSYPSKEGLGVDSFDREGRLIRTEFPGFTLFNVYFPNGQRGKERLDYKLGFYRQLLDQCRALHDAGQRVIICGDFNTAHQAIDLRNPRQNEGNSGFLPEERLWIDHYLASGFRDAYRELYPDQEQYTWWTYRYQARERDIGWRLDYFLVSEDLLPRVEDVIIHTRVSGSDHCPVSLCLNL